MIDILLMALGYLVVFALGRAWQAWRCQSHAAPPPTVVDGPPTVAVHVAEDVSDEQVGQVIGQLYGTFRRATLSATIDSDPERIGEFVIMADLLISQYAPDIPAGTPMIEALQIAFAKAALSNPKQFGMWLKDADTETREE